MNFIKQAAKSAEKAAKSVQKSLCDKEDAVKASSASEEFLHGHLFLHIFEAKNLPDMESWVAKLYDSKDVTDPYVDVHLGKAAIAKTSVILNDMNPVWNEFYRIEVCHQAAELRLSVSDKDHAYSEKIGEVRIMTASLLFGDLIEGWFPIIAKGGKQDGELRLSVQYVPASATPKSYDVHSYFKPTRGNHVKLYQDAHCPEGLPQFAQLSTYGDSFINYQPGCYFQDLRESILAAESLICITGWAVWDKLHLLRGAQDDGQTLGQMLVDKANAGVNVYVMVWSEKTSGDVIGNQGVMGTHDMETFNFFKPTKVTCALAPRELEVNEFTDFLQNEFASGAYTHHQKCVILDEASTKQPGQRRLVAYVGGLDLTGGRWDTPDHPLYETLLNEHFDDFRNSNAKSVPPDEGPREPWHDIHCRLQGPVAHDVFLNFYERWARQGIKYGRLDPIDTSRIDIHETCDDDYGSWNCQIFRSITSDSAAFQPQKGKEILNSKKGRLVDHSIAQAYVQMIRNAETSIYIENQYFMGSAFAWASESDTNCHHVIPVEIAQKIVDKIHQRQRFVAYIVIPMFPEGDPTSPPIQEILYWQYKTMEMMYAKVGQALQATGSDSHPTDWLLFLCPGKRERDGEHLQRLAPANEMFAKIFRQSLRFPIYVHSKMMIVDDTYIIIGSANINQRSMAGSRDTEIAVGAYQPHALNQGQVLQFRLALWAEHLKASEPVFLQPASMECVQRVKLMASHNWSQYLNKEETPGQLLSYPLNVMADGKLEYIENVSAFPDFPASAKIKGKPHPAIPQKVTT